MKPRDNSNPVDSLRSIPAYATLDATVLDALENVAMQKKYAAKQVVFIEGEICAGYYIVQKGWLKAVKISITGREQIIQFLGAGETFNEESVVTGSKNQVTVEALELSSVWIIQRESLLRLMDEYPSLAQIITQSLAFRVTDLTNLIESLALQTVESRLARMFLEHSTGEFLNRRPWSTQSEMAARLGTVPDVPQPG